MNNPNTPKIRKIIHVDMDCFFAAVEIRDNPSLRNKPVGVGALPGRRGVLSTCNYIARKYGLHSAMPTAQALKLCPNLVIVPHHMERYKRASKVIYRIFKQYTPLVETLSLDEAFLDVSNCKYCKGSATLIAQVIKKRIKKEIRITASAGVAPNKFLAKVASDWKKPDGLFVITPSEVDDFVKKLPITKIFGVGKVTANKMHSLGIKTCADLQKIPLEQLKLQFGKSGARFFDLCRGIDNRPVEPSRQRKSLSVEQTFLEDLNDFSKIEDNLLLLLDKLQRRLDAIKKLPIHKLFVKIKFSDFTQTSIEITMDSMQKEKFLELLHQGLQRKNLPVRLIGIGVRFKL